MLTLLPNSRLIIQYVDPSNYPVVWYILMKNFMQVSSIHIAQDLPLLAPILCAIYMYCLLSNELVAGFTTHRHINCQRESQRIKLKKLLTCFSVYTLCYCPSIYIIKFANCCRGEASSYLRKAGETHGTVRIQISIGQSVTHSSLVFPLFELS